MCTFQFPTCTSYLLLCLWVQHDTHWAFSHWIPLFGKDPFQLGDDSIVVEAGGCQVTQVLSVNNKSTAYLPYGRWGKTLWDCCRKSDCWLSLSLEGLIAKSARRFDSQVSFRLKKDCTQNLFYWFRPFQEEKVTKQLLAIPFINKLTSLNWERMANQCSAKTNWGRGWKTQFEKSIFSEN